MTTLNVGNGQQYSTVAMAVAAAQPGDTIDIQAGTYTNDFPGYINGLTVQGVGGQVNLVATRAPPNGKAYLDEGGTTTIAGLAISGVTDASGNGAAIRYEGGTLTLQSDTLTGNQDGLLGGPDPSGTISIAGSTISDNGTSAGNAHDLYIGNITQFTIKGSSVTDANTGHEIKSRAMNNTITGDAISDANSNASYEIDLPNSGNATIDNDTITKGANSGNPSMISYGEEGGANTLSGSPNSGTSVDLTNDTFNFSAYTAHQGHVLNDPNGAPTITGSSDTLKGISQSQANVPASLFQSAPPPTSQTSVVLGLAEDASNGNAIASVAIDGTTLGTPAVKVLQSSGNYQAYSYTDQLAAGNHNLVVTLTNPAAGRALYIDHANINGRSYPSSLPDKLGASNTSLTIPFQTS